MNKENTQLLPASDLPRIGMVSTHGYVAADPPLGAADTGGQVVYVIELAKKLAQLGYEVDICVRADLRRFIEAWRGIRDIRNEIRAGRIEVLGPPSLTRKFPEWLKLSGLAIYPRKRQGRELAISTGAK